MQYAHPAPMRAACHPRKAEKQRRPGTRPRPAPWQCPRGGHRRAARTCAFSHGDRGSLGRHATRKSATMHDLSLHGARVAVCAGALALWPTLPGKVVLAGALFFLRALRPGARPRARRARPPSTLERALPVDSGALHAHERTRHAANAPPSPRASARRRRLRRSGRAPLALGIALRLAPRRARSPPRCVPRRAAARARRSTPRDGRGPRVRSRRVVRPGERARLRRGGAHAPGDDGPVGRPPSAPRARFRRHPRRTPRVPPLTHPAEPRLPRAPPPRPPHPVPPPRRRPRNQSKRARRIARSAAVTSSPFVGSGGSTLASRAASRRARRA